MDATLARRHRYSCAAFTHGAEWRLGGDGDGGAGLPLTVDDYVEGLRVVRGPDWEWGEQDGGAGHSGTVMGRDSSGWLRVRWDTGGDNSYRAAEKRDLCRAPDGLDAGLKAGDTVEYYSKTNGKWVPAKVTAAHHDRRHVDLDVRRGAARTNMRPVGAALLSEAAAGDASAGAATGPAQMGVLRWRFRVTGGGNWQCGVVAGDSTVGRAARTATGAPPPHYPVAAATPSPPLVLLCEFSHPCIRSPPCSPNFRISSLALPSLSHLRLFLCPKA